jgi:hypothetical protein
MTTAAHDEVGSQTDRHCVRAAGVNQTGQDEPQGKVDARRIDRRDFLLGRWAFSLEDPGIADDGGAACSGLPPGEQARRLGGYERRQQHDRDMSDPSREHRLPRAVSVHFDLAA